MGHGVKLFKNRLPILWKLYLYYWGYTYRLTYYCIVDKIESSIIFLYHLGNSH